MTLFGMTPRRALLYAGVIAVLAGLNVYRLMPDETLGGGDGSAGGSAPIELPDFAFDPAPPPTSPDASRDLFRAVAPRKEPLPEPPPPPPEPEPDPVDPRAEAIARANRSLDAFSVIGIMGAEGNRVAVVKKDDKTNTVAVGDQLISGFVVRRIDADGMVVGSGGLQFERRFELGR